MATQKDYLREFAEQVYAAKPGESLPAFWKKDAKSWKVGPAAQAAMVTLWRDGKLSCAGEPGNMTFYTSSNKPGRWMYKVTGYIQAYFTLVAYLYLLAGLATIGSKMGDGVGLILATAGLVGYLCKVSLPYSHGPLASNGIPRDYKRFGYHVKVGAHTLGWVCSVAFLIVLGRRIITDEYQAVGLANIVPAFIESLNVHDLLETEGVSPWALLLGFIVAQALGIVGAWFVGVSHVMGVDNSRHLMKFYSLYDKFLTQVHSYDAGSVQSKGVAIGFTAALIFAVSVVRHFW